MKKYGILMKPDLAQQAHDGEKDVTRRLIPEQMKLWQKYAKHDNWIQNHDGRTWYTSHPNASTELLPRYPVGTVLAVRETHWRWGRHERNEKGNWRFVPQHAKMHGDEVIFSRPPYLCPADRSTTGYHKRPGIHMLWDDARTYVEIVGARPERLHDITGAETRREGVTFDAVMEILANYDTADVRPYHWIHDGGDAAVAEERVYRLGFAVLWDSINAARCPWSSNPWVWRYEYKRVSKPS